MTVDESCPLQHSGMHTTPISALRTHTATHSALDTPPAVQEGCSDGSLFKEIVRTGEYILVCKGDMQKQAQEQLQSSGK